MGMKLLVSIQPSLYKMQGIKSLLIMKNAQTMGLSILELLLNQHCPHIFRAQNRNILPSPLSHIAYAISMLICNLI